MCWSNVWFLFALVQPELFKAGLAFGPTTVIYQDDSICPNLESNGRCKIDGCSAPAVEKSLLCFFAVFSCACACVFCFNETVVGHTHAFAWDNDVLVMSLRRTD
jgi:hypothetical protein